MICNNPECSNEVIGKGRTCSDKCRKALSRLSVTGNTAPSVTSPSVTTVIEQASVTPFIRSRIGGCKCAIPGDEDYTGVCQKIDGQWLINDNTEQQPLTGISRIDLEQKIKAYPNDQWINSPEHNELMRRLRSWSIEKLKGLGYSIPAWKMVA